MPEIVRTIDALRAIVGDWRRAGLSIGMVPTMGALHEGHLALVRAAEQDADRVVVTLFVNPAQFAPSEDLDAYPRREAEDARTLSATGAHLLFAPSAAEMYPPGFATKIDVGGAAAGLETDFRPGFFSGVATIVAKLLLAGAPDQAYFGEKDYQQLLVVRQLVRDLNIPTLIVGCPTVREPDGLARSSRNVYLSQAERKRAPRLHSVLGETAARIRSEGSAAGPLDDGRATLAAAGFAVDYLALRDAETLHPAQGSETKPLRLLVAARLGQTRLIDNVSV